MREYAYNRLVAAARNFIDIDDEVHSAPEDEPCNVIIERAKRYTDARRKLILLIKEQQ